MDTRGSLAYATATSAPRSTSPTTPSRPSSTTGVPFPDDTHVRIARAVGARSARHATHLPTQSLDTRSLDGGMAT